MGNINNTLTWSPYDNVELYHPDGKLMCFLSNKRANWYMKKDLVKIIGDKKVQLLFMPKGDGEPNELLIARKNCCVVNGDDSFLTRHHVIPSQFRSHFKLKYKDKNCFDLVLLGREIHDDYERYATVFKNRLFEDYITHDVREFYADFALGRNLSNSIKNHFSKIPHTRQIWITMRLDGIKEKWELTDADFKKKSPHDIKNYNKRIVDLIGEENLIVMWKYHFMKWAQPKFLPDWWKPNLIKTNKSKSNSEIFYKQIDFNLLNLLNKYDCI